MVMMLLLLLLFPRASCRLLRLLGVCGWRLGLGLHKGY